MALIPPDAAIRLRMEAETSLSPVAPLKEIAANLPDLRPGQTFTAQIQQPLPENGYRALVAGKEILLSLPDTVKAGDTLELVVVERNPRMVVARLADAAAITEGGEGNQPSATAQLSAAGQLIGKLLAPLGQNPEPVTLNRGAALLASPLPEAADIAAVLAPKLQQAAAQSGLFYEAHQALWLTGQHSTAALLTEPQARHAAPPQAASATTGQRAEVDGTLAATQGPETESVAGAKDLLQSIPAELRPLVQQQLDAAATQRLAWQGEVWQGQTMQWQISREAPERAGLTPEQSDRWNTSLALTMPGLGRVEASLGIIGNTVNIRLASESADSAAVLNSRLQTLQSALEAAGLKPLMLQVKHGDA